MESALPDWRRAFGGAAGTGRLRVELEDFRVDEELGFAPSGAGEHMLLHVEKRDANTAWVARAIAKCAGVPPRDVGYAGMKDRRAVTRQWFSVGLAGRPEPDWKSLEDGSMRVLEAHRHHRKLRRGALTGNRFGLRIRDISADPALLEQRLAAIAAHGFPNYFGPQRFGHQGDNILRARRMLAGLFRERDRLKRGIYLSAARSLLFNTVLDHRIALDCWDRPLPGDVLMLEGSHAFFVAETIDETVTRRVAEGDVHPSGPLWGRGAPPVTGEALAVELAALETLEGIDAWRSGLEGERLDQDRRSLRVLPRDLEWQVAGSTCELAFSLPAGCYATSLLREVLDCEEEQRS